MVAAFLAGSAGAQVLPIVPSLLHSASVALSSTRPGARAVTVTLTLGYEMQCGSPGPGPVTVTFPTPEGMPLSIRASSVTVDGRPAVSTAISAHTVTVGLPAPPPVICDVIGPGRLVIVFRSSADLGNPLRVGRYSLSAARGADTFSASFTIGV